MNQRAVKQLRCAIYTRVSTEHGLEQEFNSLDNQREAAEAYIKSQAHEGWRLHPARYDDGGFSGGSLDRPALQRLLEHIRSGQIDVVVVYKVDRLTRALADFAKLVELFDQYGVSFVSVTQAFNTTSSMGRLTLNVLLSFAQFEREVTGERIRDKIAASKRKGLRVGGPLPLGYGTLNKKLVVNTSEAETVCLIFQRYLDLGCLTKLLDELRRTGVVTKCTARKDGSVRGGIPFTKGPLAHVLANRVYIGEIVHKGAYYPGEHEPIVDRDLFDAVQALRAANRNGRSRGRMGSDALLLGRIFDDRGHRMTPSHAQKGGVRYRYYVSCVLAQGRRADAGSVARVPAPEIESKVIEAVRAHGGEPSQGEEEPEAALVARRLKQVVVRGSELAVVLNSEEAGKARTLVVPWSPAAHPRRRSVILADERPGRRVLPITAEARAKLLAGIAQARAWVGQLVSGAVPDTHAIAARERISERSVRTRLGLAFVSPDLVMAAIEGTLPNGCGLSRLAELPADWAKQRRDLVGAGRSTLGW